MAFSSSESYACWGLEALGTCSAFPAALVQMDLGSEFCWQTSPGGRHQTGLNTGRRDLKKFEEPNGQVCVIDAAGRELLEQRVQRAAHLRDRDTRAITQRRARVTGIKSRLVTSTDSNQTLKMQKTSVLPIKMGAARVTAMLLNLPRCAVLWPTANRNKSRRAAQSHLAAGAGLGEQRVGLGLLGGLGRVDEAVHQHRQAHLPPAAPRHGAVPSQGRERDASAGVRFRVSAALRGRWMRCQRLRDSQVAG